MLKIAVCDDDITELQDIVSIINEYKELRVEKLTVETVIFPSAVDLIAAIGQGQSFDVVLLDIIMPLMTGMEAASEIRHYNQDVKIVFITSSTEHAVDSYAVRAFHYMLKPVGKAALHSILDRIVSEIDVQAGASFLLKSKNGLVRVFFNKLEFAEVIGRTIIYHLADGSTLEAIGSMAGLEKLLLAENGFVKPHRSYIVNMAHINTLSQRHIKMHSQAVVPMSKANFGATKTAYLSFAFHKL